MLWVVLCTADSAAIYGIQWDLEHVGGCARWGCICQTVPLYVAYSGTWNMLMGVLGGAASSKGRGRGFESRTEDSVSIRNWRIVGVRRRCDKHRRGARGVWALSLLLKGCLID